MFLFLLGLIAFVSGDNLEVRTVQVGETVVIPCPFSSPGGSVRWLQEGAPVLLDPSAPRRRQWTVRGDGSPPALTIVSARRSDAGRWQCQELDTAGEVREDADLLRLVVDSPSATPSSSSTVVSPSEPFLEVEGRRLLHQATLTAREPQALRLHCVVTGAVPPVRKVLWTLGEANVTSWSELFVEFSAAEDAYTSRSVLALNASRDLHGKDLVCRVHHPAWLQAAAVSVSLDVLYDPSFSISRDPEFGFPLTSGLRVSLRCEVDANPPSAPLWVRDDGPLLGGAPQAEPGLLLFPSVGPEHAGWYRCTTDHPFGFFASFGYFLNVHSVDAPFSTVGSPALSGVQIGCEHDGRPEVRALNKSLLALAGRSALLAGRLCSDTPLTRVLWVLPRDTLLRPGQLKYPFIAYNITPTEVEKCWLAGLELRRLGPEDSGEVLLLARNEVGLADATFTLNVTGASELASTATGRFVVTALLPLCLLWLLHRNGS